MQHIPICGLDGSVCKRQRGLNIGGFFYVLGSLDHDPLALQQRVHWLWQSELAVIQFLQI